MAERDLSDALKRRIAATGPITVADYMAEALAHPTAGYYATRDPFGRAGDFITAPEVSQMFGELIGLWCAQCWIDLGRPSPVSLVELGPGRGTLMADALRALRQVPDLRAVAAVHLVEISPALKRKQREALAGEDVTWHDDVTQVPDGPLLLIANEFFDALPIRQFERRDGAWRERLVGLDPESGELAFMLSPPGPAAAALVRDALRDAPDGAVAEVCPAALAQMADIAGRIARHGGAALVVDYGQAAPEGRPTLQAVRAHERQDVLSQPGVADLTAHVDFGSLAKAAEEAGARAHGPVDQGALLRHLGIEARAEMLRAGATEAQRRDIDAGMARLCDPSQMGALFKALAVLPRDGPEPAGFPLNSGPGRD